MRIASWPYQLTKLSVETLSICQAQVSACTAYYPTLYLPPDAMVGTSVDDGAGASGTSEGARWGIC